VIQLRTSHRDLAIAVAVASASVAWRTGAHPVAAIASGIVSAAIAFAIHRWCHRRGYRTGESSNAQPQEPSLHGGQSTSEQTDAPAPAAVHAAIVAQVHGMAAPPNVNVVPATHATPTAAHPALAAPQHAARQATPPMLATWIAQPSLGSPPLLHVAQVPSASQL